MHSPRYQPFVEITQNRGAFETDRPGGTTVIGGRGASVQDALALGCRLGFVGGTDNHYAQPGSSRCAKGGVDFHDHVTGGLTGVFASALTREAILAALWARRCYATTGARMLLYFRVDGHMMGEEFTAAVEHVRVAGRIVGTAPVARVEVVRNNEVVHTQSGEGRVSRLDHRALLAASGTTYIYLRVTQEDGQVGWTSPVWVSKASDRNA
jgi:hypothetical protein